MSSSAALLTAFVPSFATPKEKIMTEAEQLSFILSGADKELQNRALVYCTFKTIQKNGNITVRHLRSILSQELFLADERIDAAVSSLTSPSMFNTINRWRPNSKLGIENTILSVSKTVSLDFAAWLSKLEKEHPAVLAFVPPVFIHKN